MISVWATDTKTSGLSALESLPKEIVNDDIEAMNLIQDKQPWTKISSNMGSSRIVWANIVSFTIETALCLYFDVCSGPDVRLTLSITKSVLLLVMAEVFSYC